MKNERRRRVEKRNSCFRSRLRCSWIWKQSMHRIFRSKVTSLFLDLDANAFRFIRPVKSAQSLISVSHYEITSTGNSGSRPQMVSFQKQRYNLERNQNQSKSIQPSCDVHLESVSSRSIVEAVTAIKIGSIEMKEKNRKWDSSKREVNESTNRFFQVGYFNLQIHGYDY